MPVAALVVGILSLLCGIIGGCVTSSAPVVALVLVIIGLIGGIVGIVLSAKAKKNFPEKKGMAIGGLVCSIIAVVDNASTLACAACAVAAVGAAVSSM